jgi:hypothetical protein
LLPDLILLGLNPKPLTRKRQASYGRTGQSDLEGLVGDLEQVCAIAVIAFPGGLDIPAVTFTG